MGLIEFIAAYSFYITLISGLFIVWLVIDIVFIPVRIAYFYNSKGIYQGRQKFKKKDTTIEFRKKRYNIDFEDGFVHTEKRALGITKYYKCFYYIGNSNPLRLGAKLEPDLTPELYNTMFTSKVAQDLNNFSKKGLEFLKDPKIIIMILITIAAIWYFASGGTLTGTAK